MGKTNGETTLGVAAARDGLSAAAEQLAHGLVAERLPRHVAVIMDGNGRWAQQQGFMRIYGHRQGVISVRETVTAARALGIGYLTLYAFSVENWRRSKAEVDALMRLLREFLRRERPTMLRRSIRLNALGRTDDLPAGVRRTLEHTIEATAGGEAMTLNLALSYGGRAEIVDAANQLVADIAAGRRGTEPISEEEFAAKLTTAGQPDPDLMIRTSGELRISNFLLWQLSYAELYVTSVLWPEFRDTDFVTALLDYQRRERRFGGTVARNAL